MNDSQQLRDAMWDLVYGLLSDDESQALIARIKSDPQAARLYAQVHLQADLVGQAARIEDSSLTLSASDAAAATTLTRPKPAAALATGRPATVKDRSHRGGLWLAGIAATALAVLLAVGLLWPQPNEQLLARGFLATDVVAQRSMPAGLTNQVALRTYAVSPGGDPLEGIPATLEVRLLSRSGQEQFRKAVQTNDIGQASVEIPGDALQPGVRLEVAESRATSNDADAELRHEAVVAKANVNRVPSVSAELPVEPEPQMAYFLLAEPTVDPAKPVAFSCWNFSAFSNQPTPAEQSQAALESVKGFAITKSDAGVGPNDGVVNGVLQMNEAEPRPAATALAANASQSLADLRLRRNKEATEALADQNLKQSSQTSSGRRQAGAERESLAVGGAAAGQPARSEAEKTAAGLPIHVAIPSELQGKAVLAAAICRGVTVATASVNASQPRSSKVADRDAPPSSEGQLSLALPPEADGWVEVVLFDRNSDTQQPVHREYVYREPLRKLQIDLPDLRPRFAPGEEVQLTLRVMDEKGRPAEGIRVGARVWNEQLAHQAAAQPVLLADAGRSGDGEVFNRADAGSSLPQQKLAAGGNNVALSEQLLEKKSEVSGPAFEYYDGQPVAIVLPQSVELTSSREAVKAGIRQATSAAESRRQRTIATIGGAALFGGIAVLLLMGMLATLRMASSIRMTAPVLATALASVLLGLSWLGWLPPARFGQIAMAPAASSAAARLDHDSKPESKRGEDLALQPAAPSYSAPANTPASALDAPSAGAGAQQNAPGGVPAEPPASLASVAPPAPSRELEASPGVVGAQPSRPSALPLAAEEARPSGPAASGKPQGAAAFSRALAPASPLVLEQQRNQPAAGGQAAARGGAAGLGAERDAAAAGRLAVPFKAALPNVELAAQPEAKNAADELAKDKSAAASAPAALYFNPQLVTDAGGRVTIRFKMPATDSEYRLLIDALGHGRIGSRQELLVCGAAVSK